MYLADRAPARRSWCRAFRRLLAELPRTLLRALTGAAVMDENVLGKATTSGREWAFRQLRRFYALDPQSLLFRALRDLWEYDPDGQPLLALLCALARDPVLRASAAVIVGSAPGEVVTTSDFQAAIEGKFPGAYNELTLRTTAQKVASSWDQAGYLHQEKPAQQGQDTSSSHFRCNRVCTDARVPAGSARAGPVRHALGEGARPADIPPLRPRCGGVTAGDARVPPGGRRDRGRLPRAAASVRRTEGRLL